MCQSSVVACGLTQPPWHTYVVPATSRTKDLAAPFTGPTWLKECTGGSSSSNNSSSSNSSVKTEPGGLRASTPAVEGPSLGTLRLLAGTYDGIHDTHSAHCDHGPNWRGWTQPG